MEEPTQPQRQLLDQLPAHTGDLGPILQTQLAKCRTAAKEYCEECFDVDVSAGTPLLPPGTDCPLHFEFEDELGGNGVLLWHENGVVGSVEIMYVGDHPTLAGLKTTG